MLYREIIAVCSKILTKHINTVCGQNVELLKLNWWYIYWPVGFTRLNQIDIGGLHHKLHPYRYSIAPFILIYNPTGIRSYELKTWIYYFYILSESASWDQLCSSTIGPGRLNILYELHTSIRRLLLASPKRLIRQSLYSCCIRAVKILGSGRPAAVTLTLQSTESITRYTKFLMMIYPFSV